MKSLLVVVSVVLAVYHRRDDLAAGVRAADRADTVRTARGVTARALAQRGRSDLVLSAALGGTTVRLLFLGDGHIGWEG
jgi:hypothetical protein